MAPEQLEGKEADGRTDIFAFGAVVYEMATGKKAFEGKSQASLIGAIMQSNPRPMSELQPITPQLLERIVRKCLSKEPDRRWQTSSDLHDELVWVTEADPETKVAGETSSLAGKSHWERIAWATALLVAIALWVLSPARPSSTDQTIRFSIPVPQLADYGLSVSDDGMHIAAGVFDPEQNTTIWLRSLDSLEGTAITGERTTSPVWSPDGQNLAFRNWSLDKLMRVSVRGGAPQEICALPGGSLFGGGGSWSHDGVIIFSSQDTIYSVPATGGDPVPITVPDEGETHLAPEFLPDGERFLYVKNPGGVLYVKVPGEGAIEILSGLDGPARYSPTGHVVFARQRALWSQRFDLRNLEALGSPTRVASDLTYGGRWPLFDVSDKNIYYQSGTLSRQLVWVDRTGREIGQVGEPGNYTQLSLSPNERQVALQADVDIWIYDLDRGILSPLTRHESSDYDPIWMDNRTILFSSNRDREPNLYRKSVGSDDAVALLSPKSGTNRFIEHFHQGQAVFLQQSGSVWQIATVILGEDAEPEILFNSPNTLDEANISPDGEWLSYNSNRSGQHEVYIRPLAGGDAVQVSRDGGGQARWNGDSRELTFLGMDGSLYAVAVKEGDLGEPKQLFQTGMTADPVRDQYAMTADGERFLLFREVSESSLTVVQNWTAELDEE
jgi:Tol biopolymer transport system component